MLLRNVGDEGDQGEQKTVIRQYQTTFDHFDSHPVTGEHHLFKALQMLPQLKQITGLVNGGTDVDQGNDISFVQHKERVGFGVVGHVVQHVDCIIILSFQVVPELKLLVVFGV